LPHNRQLLHVSLSKESGPNAAFKRANLTLSRKVKISADESFHFRFRMQYLVSVMVHLSQKLFQSVIQTTR